MPLAAALLVLATSGCEDPSNVGIGLIGDEQGGQPAVRSADPSEFQNAALQRATGSQPRVLAGRVDDPLAGTIEATGYLDLSSAASSSFRSDVVTSAEFQFRPEYVYGDTTVEVSFRLRPLTDEFSISSPLPVDTTFATGSVLLDFSFLPTDTLVVVPMPSSWVEENDEVLRSTTFTGNFHGFQLEQTGGNAVIGFGSGSQIRAFSASDSAFYPVSRAYAAMQRLAEPNVPADRLFFQAAVGPVVSFELSIDEVDAAAINQGKLIFQSDTLTLSQKPPGFRRPILPTLDLYGVLDDGGLVAIDRAEMDDQGRFVYDGANIAVELQRMLLGTRNFDHFELRVPVGQGVFGEGNPYTSQGSVNVQLFYDTAATERAPQGFLTITPLD